MVSLKYFDIYSTMLLSIYFANKEERMKMERKDVGGGQSICILLAHHIDLVPFSIFI